MNRHIYADRCAALADLDVRELKVGADVRCERDEPAKGTWPRYAGRVGRVVSVNVQVFPDKRAYVELGVRFTRHGAEPVTWFRPSELQRCYGAFRAPRSRDWLPDGGR